MRIASQKQKRQLPRGLRAAREAEHRWALTVWLHPTEPGRIEFDAAVEEMHWPGMGAAAGGLEG